MERIAQEPNRQAAIIDRQTNHIIALPTSYHFEFSFFFSERMVVSICRRMTRPWIGFGQSVRQSRSMASL
jgi:hypothetical protein